MNIMVFADNQREFALQNALFKQIDTKKNKFDKNFDIYIELKYCIVEETCKLIIQRTLASDCTYCRKEYAENSAHSSPRILFLYSYNYSKASLCTNDDLSPCHTAFQFFNRDFFRKMMDLPSSLSSQIYLVVSVYEASGFFLLCFGYLS